MSVFKSVLFAVAREDHLVEESVIDKIRPDKMLTIGSGGCVALSLKTIFPNLSITVIDLNPHQLSHIKKKIKAIKQSDFKRLNICEQDDTCLNQSGEFEKMFQNLRRSFVRNVSGREELESFFDTQTTIQNRDSIFKKWINHKHIYTPFRDVFNDQAIEKVFSDLATKHGERGSYGKYMQKNILHGMQGIDSHLNPFLQHIFLGRYTSESVFPYIQAQSKLELKLIEGDIFSINDISSYNIVSLSNIFDWCDIEVVKKHAEHLSKLKAGSAIIIRQINNHQNWIKLFDKHFKEDKLFDQHWRKHDRSMFYDHFRLFFRK
jgi:S-adenosylmethionine-diacylglycerol 3-amino-3-carboxypropyl transferase